MLSEATRELGGRVSLESKLPGLNQWARVTDYRLQQIKNMPNVSVFRESRWAPTIISTKSPESLSTVPSPYRFATPMASSWATSIATS